MKKAKKASTPVKKRKKPKYPIVVSPEGEQVRFTSLRQFCRERGLNPEGFKGIIQRKQYRAKYKGWMTLKTWRTLTAPVEVIINLKTMEEHPMYLRQVQKWCKEHNVSKALLSYLFHQKRCLVYKGFMRKSDYEKLSLAQ